MTKEYNALANRLAEARAGNASISREDRAKIVNEIRAMDRTAAKEGKTFVKPNAAAQFELRETGLRKADAQRMYAMKFDDRKIGADGQTDRARVAKRLGIAKPAGEAMH